MALNEFGIRAALGFVVCVGTAVTVVSNASALAALGLGAFLFLATIRRRQWICVASLACAVSGISGPGDAEERCDVALALALDLSASTADQRNLVTGGTAAAPRDPAVVEAFSRQRVEVLVFAWADLPSVIIDRTPIASSADLLALAGQIERPLQARIGHGTSLIWAVDYARRRLAEVDCDRAARGLPDRWQGRQPILFGAAV